HRAVEYLLRKAGRFGQLGLAAEQRDGARDRGAVAVDQRALSSRCWFSFDHNTTTYALGAHCSRTPLRLVGDATNGILLATPMGVMEPAKSKKKFFGGPAMKPLMHKPAHTLKLDPATIGERVRERRIERGLSQKQIAAACGLSQNSVGKI